ncbi:MAG: NTP transferase domain-containing protein [Candidatus Latescibacteria bacterium]|nr:NTP transferase domain-containing protein [Candidatus Latescibacterota bacterium]
MSQQGPQVRDLLSALNSPIDGAVPRIGIVLAAGHGKRIRSETSKMLHEIWGRPTGLRVAQAVQQGLDSPNQIIVVGIKGTAVAQATGARPGRVFAYQENPVLGLPAGTGDAVRVGLQSFAAAEHDRDVYIFLGDMGLLTEKVVAQFRQSFEGDPCDMMVLTSLYSGPATTNYYGRIVRVPASDAKGHPSGVDCDKVIEIREHKDILDLDPGDPYRAVYNGRTYAFTQRELLETREINTGVFAFKEAALRTYIQQIDTDNAQGELMLTDLVEIFNRHRLVVRAAVAESEEEILAFNKKSVWRHMQAIARRWAYDKLKDTITIVDETDFFIADEVIEQILSMDKDRGPLDIVIGRGVHIGPAVQLNRRVSIGDRSLLSGHLILGEGVHIGVGVELSAYPGQTLVLSDSVEVLSRNIIKGNLQIGAHSRIESGVIMTGSDEHPMRIGARATIKGTSYLYGCLVDDDLLIEHSVIKCKRVEQVKRRDGTVQPVRYVLPQPEGLDSISDL